MAERNIKSRIVHKHDTADHWSLATGFIPKQGEIIIYDVDDTYDYERIKIGDGVTNVNSLPFSNDSIVESMNTQISGLQTSINNVSDLVGDTSVADQINTAVVNKVDKVAGKDLSTNDYTDEDKAKLNGIAEGAEVNVQADWSVNDETDPAYINNRTHWYIPVTTITLDGSLSTLPTGNAGGETVYKVSDLTPSISDLENVKIVFSDSYTVDITSDYITEIGPGCISIYGDAVHIVTNQSGLAFNYNSLHYSFPETGIYFVNGLKKFQYGSAMYHQLDERYIPDTIARTSSIDAITNGEIDEICGSTIYAASEVKY